MVAIGYQSRQRTFPGAISVHVEGLFIRGISYRVGGDSVVRDYSNVGLVY